MYSVMLSNVFNTVYMFLPYHTKTPGYICTGIKLAPAIYSYIDLELCDLDLVTLTFNITHSHGLPSVLKNFHLKTKYMVIRVFLVLVIYSYFDLDLWDLDLDLCDLDLDHILTPT